MAQLKANIVTLGADLWEKGQYHIALLEGMGFVHQSYDLRKRIELGCKIGLALPFRFLRYQTDKILSEPNSVRFLKAV